MATLTKEEIQVEFDVLKNKALAFHEAIRKFDSICELSLNLEGWINDNMDTIWDIEQELDEDDEDE